MDGDDDMAAFAPDRLNTMIISWVFTAASIIIMAARLIATKYRKKAFSYGDYLTMLAILMLAVRTSTSHVSLVWGSNNMSASMRETTFSAEEISRMVIGSKLVLVTRVFYNNYIWIQKAVVMLLIERVLRGQPWTEFIVKAYVGLLAVTYVVVQVVIFVECRPVYLYWQVQPDPGTCTQAFIHVIVLGTLNILTDLILILLPLPPLFSLKRSLLARLRIMSLFSLGFFVVIVTIVRIVLHLHNGTSQTNRTTLASAEIFAAACVANIPILYTLRHRKDEDQQATRTDSMVGPLAFGPESEFRKVTSGTGYAEGFERAEDGIRVHMTFEMEDRRVSMVRGGVAGLETNCRFEKRASWMDDISEEEVTLGSRGRS